MQVTETKNEGLSREFAVVIPASDVEIKVTERLKELSATIKLPGFRPGKVPMSLVRKRYGANVMGEVLERAVNETSTQVLTDHALRPAQQPKIEVTKFDEGGDLEYTIALEVLPAIELTDFSKISLERLVAKPDEAELQKSLDRMAEAYKTAEPIKGARKSKTGDVAVIDFVGKVDGVEFPGGKAEDYSLELGSGSFIPGFEEQLVGVKAGDDIEVKVSFPKEYGAEDLAGKDAVFDVKVKELRETAPAQIDDELAKKAGMDTLDDLKKAINEEHERGFKDVSRQKLKRALLDALAATYDFELPQSLVDGELESIEKQFEESKKAGHEEDDGKSDDDRKVEFKEIAERRVRLGLVLAEVGRTNEIKVSQEDLNKAMFQEAKRYPGQEQAVIDYFRQNPDAMQQLSSPIFEDKVIDFILEMTKVTDKVVDVETLLAPEDEDVSPKTSAKKPAAKKAPAKKASVKKPAAKKTSVKAKGESAEKAE